VDLFVCWSDSDPFYQDYFPDCRLQISLSHVTRAWNISRFENQPAKLMIDSGAFSLINDPTKKLSPKQVFDQQLIFAKGSQVETILCHLDYPIPPGTRNSLEVYKRIETTIANAYEFMELFRSANLPPNFKSMGVIQGNSYDTISFCARELKRIGFDQLGLGSLAAVFHQQLIIERVQFAVDVVGPDIHVFGISGIQTVAALMAMGVRSFDSSRPMKASMYNCVLYSQPFRRYGLRGSKIQKDLPTLTTPLECDCPICQEDPTLIMGVGSKKANNLRAVHNFYHLRRELEAISRMVNITSQ